VQIVAAQPESSYLHGGRTNFLPTPFVEERRYDKGELLTLVLNGLQKVDSVIVLLTYSAAAKSLMIPMSRAGDIP
jgi:hypothetical protein